MRGWLRHRRERAERIEDEAGELIHLLGDDAYAEARWREQTASSPAAAREWTLIALAIARKTSSRIGLDLSSRMAMNAVFAPDREPGKSAPRHLPGLDPLAELNRVLSTKLRRFRIQFLCGTPAGRSVLNEIEIRAADVSDAIVSAAGLSFPPKTTGVRILDQHDQVLFERHKADRQREAR